MKNMSLQDWSNIGAMAQSIVVIFGIGFAFHEVSTRMDRVEKEKILMTMSLHESIRETGFIAELEHRKYAKPVLVIEGLEHSLEYQIPFLVGAYKDVERVSLCLIKGLCDSDAVEVLLCPSIGELSAEEAVFWDHTEEVEKSLRELWAISNQLSGGEIELLRSYRDGYDFLERKVMQLRNEPIGPPCEIDY